MKDKILQILSDIIHPENGLNIVEGKIVESITAEDGKIIIALNFHKTRDPFEIKIKNAVETAVKNAFEDCAVTVFIRQGETNAAKAKQNEQIEQMHRNSAASAIKNVIAISSGKGGVGKSTVTANLAVTLSSLGFKVGVLDADIYGPSQAKMFAMEGYIPDAIEQNGTEYIVPGEKDGIKIMSIAMFIKPTDALLWRGTMANSALRQLIHQTAWGELDFLLIDLPPGTGDIHLSIINEIKIGGAIIVSTPQQVAVADVIRGIEMYRNENVGIPILGVIENMAWFTPKELPQNKYYIFGEGGAKKCAENYGVDLLGQIPIIQEVMQSADDGSPAAGTNADVKEFYEQIARNIVQKMC